MSGFSNWWMDREMVFAVDCSQFIHTDMRKAATKEQRAKYLLQTLTAFSFVLMVVRNGENDFS
jgi:hypothetical protein